MNIMLLNDTATVPHLGCQAVSDAAKYWGLKNGPAHGLSAIG